MAWPKHATIKAGEIAGRTCAVRLDRNGFALRATAGFEVRGAGRSGDTARIRGFVAVAQVRAVIPTDDYPWQSREDLAAWGRAACDRFAAETPPGSVDWMPTHSR